MQIDVNNLESQVKPIIRNGRKYTEDAISFLWGLKIPSDFSYATRLKRIPTDISNAQNQINKIQNWLEEAINSFKNAENKNKNLINSINANTTTMQTNIKDAKIDKNNDRAQDEVDIEAANRLVNSTKNTISNAFEYGIKIKGITNTKGEIASYYSVDNNLEAALMTGAFVAAGIESKIKTKVEDKLGGLGTLMSGAWEGLTKIASDIGNVAKRTAASVSNVVIGFGKGVCNFFEGLAKVGCMIQTATLTATTGLFDAASYTFSAITGNTENWSSLTSKMWKNTMSITSENYVNSAYKSFYEETMIGQWLDENAYEICKSNGILTNISSAIGEIASAVVLTFLTFGAFPTMSFAPEAVGAFFTGVSKTGNYTSQKWAEARDSSWEGIERMKEKGEISQEQYDSFITIRQLSDEQWKEVKSDYENGNITEEMYNQMKQIREMPDDWRTLENGFKGFMYGSMNGVWEGIQYYFGGKLAGKAIGGLGRFGSSAVRVGVDTTFNAADTPYRVLVDTMTSDKSLVQAWEDQGGWESVITSIGIGLIASAGGEAIDFRSSKTAIKSVDTSKIKIDIDKIDDILNNTNAFKGYDENLAKQLKDAIKQDYIDGKIDLDKILKDGTINHNIAYKLNSFDNITEQIIDVDKIGELPSDFFKNIEHPEKISFIYKGKKHTYDDLLKNYFKEYSSDVKQGTKNIETNVKNTQKIEQNTQRIEMKDKNANVKQIEMKDKVDVDTKKIETNVKNKVDTNANKIDFEREIFEANKQTRKGGFYVINVESLDQIPDNFFNRIDDPSSVSFIVNGEKETFASAKLKKSAKNTKIETSLEKEIEIAKEYTKNGKIYKINVNSLDELPPNFLEQFDNPDALVINVNGKIYNYTNFHELNLNSSTMKKVTDKIQANSNINTNNLKNEILSKVTDIEDETLLAKALYEELNKKVNYDFKYIFGDKVTKQEILNNNINFNNLNNNSSVVCKGWAELYEELLKEKGINCKVIKSQNRTHWWVEIYTKDGKRIVADATEKMGGKKETIDLVNSKIGAQSKGFFILNEDQIGLEPYSIIQTQKQIDNIAKIDKELGYSNKNGYLENNMKIVNDKFKLNIFKNSKKKIKYQNYLEALEFPEGVTGYDVDGYLKELKKVNDNIFSSLFFRKNGSELESICSVEVSKTEPPIYQLYGEKLGKIEFNSYKEMCDYIGTLDIVKR